MLFGDENGALVESLAEPFAEAGIEALPAGSSLQDTVLMLGCEASDGSCLDQVIEMGGVDGLVIVPVEPGGLIVRRGGETLESPSVDPTEVWAVEKALLQILGIEAAAEPEVPVQDEVPEAALVVSEPPPAKRGPVKMRTWIVLGSGAAATGLGLALFSVASSKQNRVDDHPVDSVADLNALRDLEASGAAYSRAGNVFMIAGSLAVAGGVALLLWDPAPGEHLTLEPTVTSSGAGVSLRWGLQ